jgi:Methyltransferase FkbM domain
MSAARDLLMHAKRLPPSENTDRDKPIEVEVRRLDDLALDPTFVKLDVQGHEHPALVGMAKTLERYGPPVLIEGPSDETTAFRPRSATPPTHTTTAPVAWCPSRRRTPT